MGFGTNKSTGKSAFYGMEFPARSSKCRQLIQTQKGAIATFFRLTAPRQRRDDTRAKLGVSFVVGAT